jgi:hypothetical protein
VNSGDPCQNVEPPGHRDRLPHDADYAVMPSDERWFRRDFTLQIYQPR